MVLTTTSTRGAARGTGFGGTDPGNQGIPDGERRWVTIGGAFGPGGPGVYLRAWPAEDTAAPTVVLVPGLAASGASVEPVAARLAGPCRVLAVDLPGFGRSPAPRRALGVVELADALAGWLRVLGVRGAGVAAFSFGCQVAVALAARHPDLVDRLVLASPTPDPQARTIPAILRRWVRESRTHSPAYRRLLPREWARTGLRRGFASLRAALDDPVEDRLPRVRAPALVLRGDRDPLVGPDWARRVAAALPDARLELLPGVPHAMSHDAADAFAGVALPFLQR